MYEMRSSSTGMSFKQNIWDRFCDRYNVAVEAVPLFDVSDGVVQTVPAGTALDRLLLRRSGEMEELLEREIDRVVGDFERGGSGYEGLIYLVFTPRDGGVVPLYIGKAEKYGKKAGALSANITKLRGKFARWGDGYAYHIGDLSAVVCPGHPDKRATTKYRRWAELLFTGFPTAEPRLRQETLFWARAWRAGDVGIWEEFGATPLSFLEYLLIGVAGDLHPNMLLNNAGVNRE